MNLSKFAKLVLISFALLISTSCTTMNTKVGGLFNLDTDLQLTFFVHADVNLDDDNISSPLIVRMYELKSPDLFKKANFIDIFEKDAQVLGADLIARQRLKYMQPGETREVSFVLSEETKYVALFAEFLRYKDAQYKLVIPIAQTNVISSSAEIKLSGNSVTIIERKPSSSSDLTRDL